MLSTLFRRGDALLRAVRVAQFDEPITYYRSGVLLGTMQAQQAESLSEVESGDYVVESRMIDWLIERSEYAGLGVEPEAGDIIAFVYADATRYFVVVAVPGESAARWHLRDAQTWRIHTREVTADEILPEGGGHFGSHFGEHFGEHFGGNWN